MINVLGIGPFIYRELLNLNAVGSFGLFGYGIPYSIKGISFVTNENSFDCSVLELFEFLNGAFSIAFRAENTHMRDVRSIACPKLVGGFVSSCYRRSIF